MIKRYFSPAVAVLVAAGVSACGGGNGVSTGSSTAVSRSDATAFTVPASGCGSFVAPLPSGSSVAQFSPEQKQAIAGYTSYAGSTLKVMESAWNKWQPTHRPPYTVGISWGQLIGGFNTQVINSITATLKTDPEIGKVIVKTTGNNLDIAEQLADYQSLVQDKPDIILLQTVSPGSFIAPVNRAAAEGIPTVTESSTIPGANAVNVDGNTYLAGAQAASFVAQQLHGSGNILKVGALAGSSVDLSVSAGFQAVYKNCPNLKQIGEVWGGFSPTLAKSVTLQFLGTHPETVNAALGVAGMTPGIMQAFLQSGRTMPLVPDVGLQKGSMAYWYHNASYRNVGVSLPPSPLGAGVAEVALRMLDGQGVKYNAIIGKEPLVDDTTLNQWVSPSWTLETPGYIPGSRASFLPPAFVASFFTRPEPLK
jgi:ribose transport system substrate-binding protein